jgi:hypothetical protein
MSRPSPPFHAANCKDKILPGNNGQIYVSRPDKRNVYTWKVFKGSSKNTTRKAGKSGKSRKSTRYTTINNGQNLWTIEDLPKLKKAIIYRNETMEKVAEFKYLKLWIPHPDSVKFMEQVPHKGTILIQTSPTKFVIVYDKVIQFEIQDKPVKFMSPLGNNDSPYPYLIGEKNVYFIGFEPFEYFPTTSLDLTKDAYDQLYGINGSIKVEGAKVLKSKVLLKI